MGEKKVIFIAGVTNVPNYWKPFEQAEEDLEGVGFVPLSPSRMPHGLSDKKARQLYMAMLQTADAVLFLPGWNLSTYCQVEMSVCKYIGKPFATSIEELKEVTK